MSLWVSCVLCCFTNCSIFVHVASQCKATRVSSCVVPCIHQQRRLRCAARPCSCVTIRPCCSVHHLPCVVLRCALFISSQSHCLCERVLTTFAASNSSRNCWAVSWAVPRWISTPGEVGSDQFHWIAPRYCQFSDNTDPLCVRLFWIQQQQITFRLFGFSRPQENNNRRVGFRSYVDVLSFSCLRCIWILHGFLPLHSLSC